MHHDNDHEPPPTPRVLVMTGTSMDGPPVDQLLTRQGVRYRECQAVSELVAQIAKGEGPVILPLDALDRDGTALLLRELRSQPYWSDVPVILLESGPDAPASPELRRQRGTTILKQPVDDEAFLGIVQTAIESRLRQIQVRDLLQHLEALHQRAAARARHLQHLAMKLARAEHDERARIAGVIHDEFQQLLVAARMRLGTLQGGHGSGGQAPRDASEWADGCREVDELLQEAIQSARGLTRELSPPILRHGGLMAALKWLVQTSQDRHGLRIASDVAPEADRLNRSLQVFFFEAARELIFNVAKHAQTNRAGIRVSVREGNALLSVKDDGRGFDPGALDGDHESPQGFGLLGISERAALLGGNLHVQSHPGGGCEVCIVLPLEVEPEIGEDAAPQEADEDLDLGTRVGDTSKNGSPRKRVLVVDDHRIVRQGIASMLARQNDIVVVGEAADGREAIEKARELCPDVVLMDVSMPGMNGIDATRVIHNELDGTEIIGLSMFEMEEIGQQMLDAGARTYLPKSGPAQELLKEIRANGQEEPAE